MNADDLVHNGTQYLSRKGAIVTLVRNVQITPLHAKEANNSGGHENPILIEGDNGVLYRTDGTKFYLAQNGEMGTAGRESVDDLLYRLD